MDKYNTDSEYVKEILDLAENFQGQKMIMEQNESFKGKNLDELSGYIDEISCVTKVELPTMEQMVKAIAGTNMFIKELIREYKTAISPEFIDGDTSEFSNGYVCAIETVIEDLEKLLGGRLNGRYSILFA